MQPTVPHQRVRRAKPLHPSPTVRSIRYRVRKARRMNRVLMSRLLGTQRTRSLNRTLGIFLACVAGMMNAGGFLILHQYTSHMTGTISSLADMMFLKEWDSVFRGIGVLFFFIVGAVVSTVMIVVGRHYRRRSQYAFPLMLEAILLIIFSFVGFYSQCSAGECIFPLMFLLSFMMGMQNALGTKLSNSEVRTTHVTGTVTDMGISLARWMLSKHPLFHQSVNFDLNRLRFNCALVLSFLIGGIIGAWGFSQVGFYFCFLPVAILLWLSVRPMYEERVGAG
jgi:uncharacterized membrane protein YoaK (UPF0700 family)